MLPPQPKGSAFWGRNFAEAIEESTSAAPMTSHIETKKCKKAIGSDRVEDSDDLDSYDFSSDGGLKIAIRMEPIDSRPPPQLKKKRLANYGLEES
jgi:hypothetical protein